MIFIIFTIKKTKTNLISDIVNEVVNLKICYNKYIFNKLILVNFIIY